MSVNIEIKSILADYEQAKLRLQYLGIQEDSVLHQKDIFYRVPFGRLKLRTIDNRTHELIIYFRHNSKSPKPSKYRRIRVKNPSVLNYFLMHIFGVRGVVEKERLLFLQDNIRFHIDKVKNLGNYFEIEYIVRESESKSIAESKVDSLLKILEISSQQLISESYIDLLCQKNI